MRARRSQKLPIFIGLIVVLGAVVALVATSDMPAPQHAIEKTLDAKALFNRQ